MKTLSFLINDAAGRLEKAGAGDPRIDAELLLLYLLGRDRSYLFLHRNEEAGADVTEKYEALVQRRLTGVPVQYILGSQEFMGLEFKVTEDVLIPRQDTETLVEWALETAGPECGPVRILDMCCGSGAIGVSMAHFLPEADVTACDISEAALNVASENARANDTAARMRFIHSDMFDVLDDEEDLGGPFDMMLCNPPYIPAEVIKTLAAEVRDHEPAGALDGGADGLDFYRIIADRAAAVIKPGGLMMLEIGHDQGSQVTELLEKAGFYEEICLKKDLAGNDRVVSCRTLKTLRGGCI